MDVFEQWAPEDTSTPIKPDSRQAADASRTLDDADRSLAAAGALLTPRYCTSNVIYNTSFIHCLVIAIYCTKYYCAS